LKKINETRRKAKNILDIRMNKEPKVKRLSSTDRALTPDVRNSLLFERKEEHKRVMHDRLSIIRTKRKEEALSIKKERIQLLRKKNMIDNAYMKTNQLKRMEIQGQVKDGLEKV